MGFIVGLVLYRSPLPGAVYGTAAAIVVYVSFSMAKTERRFQGTTLSLLFFTGVAILPFCMMWRHQMAEHRLHRLVTILWATSAVVILLIACLVIDPPSTPLTGRDVPGAIIVLLALISALTLAGLAYRKAPITTDKAVALRCR